MFQLGLFATMFNKARKKGMRTSIKVHHNLLSPSYTHVLSMTNMFKKNNIIIFRYLFFICIKYYIISCYECHCVFFLLKGNMVRVKESIHIQKPSQFFDLFPRLNMRN